MVHSNRSRCEEQCVAKPNQKEHRGAQCPGGVSGVGITPHAATPRLGQLKHELHAGADAWGNFDIIPCRDGKSRRVESGTFPLAHGIPGRVGLLRGYGNAIVPQVAAQFIASVMEP